MNSIVKREPCSKKNTTQLKKARVESVKILRKALENTYVSENGPSYYDYFKDLDWANECVFSYPGSDWVAIYLKDSNGNISWNNGKSEKFYFQIGLDSDSQPEIINYTTTIPSELVGKQNCAVVNGKCVEESKRSNGTCNQTKKTIN